MIPEDYWAMLRPFQTDPGAAFSLAQNFAEMRDCLRDPDGVREVIEMLDEGIVELYQYTDFSQACLKLYDRAISAKGLTPDVDPVLIVQRLQEAEKGKAKAKKKAKRSAKKQ